MHLLAQLGSSTETSHLHFNDRRRHAHTTSLHLLLCPG